MAVNLSPVGGAAAQFFDNDGNVLSGGKIYTYAAGTSTPAATYTTSAGSIAHANPIVLDSAGRVPGGEIWLTIGVTYKFVLNNSTGTLIGTYDNIPSQFVTDASLVTYTPAGTGAVTTNVQAKLRQYVSVKDFGAVGDGTTNDTSAIQAAINSCLTTGSALYVPAGSYLLTSQINIPLYNASSGRGFIIHGDGWASKFIVNHTGTGFYVTCNPSFNVFQAIFSDLYFTDGTSSPTRIIHNNGAINTLIRDCIFQNATVTVGCVVNDNAYGLTLEGCSFANIVGTGAFYAQTPSLSTYSFVNSIIDCDFSIVSTGVTMQGCDAFLLSNTVFQECNIGFFANPNYTQTTAFNITFDTCWFERNTTYDIQLDSDANYWCEASIRNTQFAGFDPTYQAHIQLAQKSKVTIEGTPAGNTVIVSGSNDAAAVLIRATNFVQSGTFAWTSIDPYGNVVAKTYKSLSGVYANAANATTVTLTTLPSVSSGVWLASVELDNTANATANSCFGVLTSQTGTAVYTPLKTATGLTVSVSGLNLQGNQTSGAPYSITWSLTRLS
jgi:hypothetical protein